MTTQDQSGSGSNSNEDELQTPQISGTKVSPQDTVSYHNQDTAFWESLTPLQRIESAYSKSHQTQSKFKNFLIFLCAQV